MSLWKTLRLSLKVNCLKPVGDVAQRKRFTAALSLLPISEHTHLKEINIMKEFGSWFFAAIFFLGVAGCASSFQRDNNIISFSTADFHHLVSVTRNDSIFLGSPNHVYFINNDIWMIDKYDNYQLSIINKEESKRVAPKGQGPNEFLNIYNITYNSAENSICVYDDAASSCIFYRADSLKALTDINYIGQVKFRDIRTNTVIPYRDHFITNGCFKGKCFAVIDSVSIKNAFGDYPGEKSDIEDEESNFLKNQTIITTSPKQNYFVAGGVYNDWLVFYETNGLSFKKTNEYHSYDSKLDCHTEKDVEYTYYTTTETPQTIRAYRDFCASENYLYALYWGLSKEMLDEGERCCYILKFDWKGNILDGFKSDILLKTFCVNNAGNRIYAITYPQNEESKYVEFVIQ